MTLPNSSIDLKLGVLNLGLRLYFQVFSNSQRLKIGFLNVAPAEIVDFSQFMEDILKIGIFQF